MFDLNHDESMVAEFEQGVPWRHEVTERAGRWKHLFEEAQEEDRLENDPVLHAYGVTDKHNLNLRRWFTECLLDNTHREAWLSAEARKRRYGHTLTEAETTTSDVAVFTTWALPLIRKIWPRLFAHELGVMMVPMAQNTGRVHTLDFLFASSGETYSPGAYVGGSSVYPNEDPDYANDKGEGVAANKIKAQITGAGLECTSKKLLTDYTVEAMQDFMSYQRIALEPELMKILGMEIERERNREIIDGISAGATTNTNWDESQPASPDPYANATPRQFAESLWDAIIDANNEVYRRVFQDGNIILAGRQFAGRLEKLKDFKSVKRDPGSAQVMTGPNMFGTIKERFIVYKDPFYTPDKAIVIHKSNIWMYVMYVVGMYVPLWVSPTIAKEEFTFAKGVLSRYAKFLKNGDFAATVTVV